MILLTAFKNKKGKKMNIKIASIGVHHPKNQKDNHYYIQKFDNKEQITNLLEKTGRNKRFIVHDPDETVITMATAASIKALDEKNLSGNDIDIIIFASTTFEYLCPTNALILHAHLNVKKDCVCFDLNANCLGMFLALDQAVLLLLSNERYKRALVIGADSMSRISHEHIPMPSTIIGDAAAALILEKTEGHFGGLIDRVYQTDSHFKDTIVYPPKGFSYTGNEENKKLDWGNFTGLDSVKFAIKQLNQLLEKHNLSIEQISCFLFSQFTKANIDTIRERAKINEDKIEYIGDQYGYTGANSLFIAYESRLKKGLLKDGDFIILWTLGAGYQTGIMLWKL